jgi:hypothetical protein
MLVLNEGEVCLLRFLQCDQTTFGEVLLDSFIQGHKLLAGKGLDLLPLIFHLALAKSTILH